ncbi:MAG: hypothetical protein JOZ25_04385, partial [Actinobacteria bacterium]|nr:hypothetical protein [Actinomycetota bacterium]
MVRLPSVLAALAALLLAATLVAAATASRAHLTGQRSAASAQRPAIVATPDPTSVASLVPARRLAVKPRGRRAAHPGTHEVLTVRPGRGVTLLSSPGGAAVARLGDRTEYGSP